MKYSKYMRWVMVVGSIMMYGACTSKLHLEPYYVYMPDMMYSPALKAQSHLAPLPPKGVIPRNYYPYPYSNEDEAGLHLKNPYVTNPEIAQRGSHLFSVVCQVCHGDHGKGDGPIVKKFVEPPSLLSDKVKAWPDGSIYHMIRAGRGLMPAYASQINNDYDRWAIVLYVRNLQKSTPS